MSKKKRDILSSDDKEIGSATGLGVIWRKLLLLLNIRPDTWIAHLNHYLRDPSNHIKDDPKSRATARGNLEKAVFATDMTWDQLLRGVKVLSYSLRRAKIVVYVETERGEHLSIEHDLIKPKEERAPRKRKSNF